MVAPIAAVQVQAEAVGQGVDLAEVDATLTEVAATGPHAQLARVVGHYLARLDPDGTEPDPCEGRSLTLSRLFDGRLAIRGELDAIGGRSCRPPWSRWCRPTGPPVISATARSSSGTPSCRSPTTCWHPGSCRCCARSSRTSWSPSTSTTSQTRPQDRRPPAWGSEPPSPPRGPAGWPATVRSPASSSGPRGCRWRWAAPDGWCRRTCAGRSSSATGPACSPAARRRAKANVHHPAIPRGPRRACESWGGGGPFTCEGPPRLPGRAATRRPMAHVPPRRHRDPPRRTAPRSSLTAARSGRAAVLGRRVRAPSARAALGEGALPQSSASSAQVSQSCCSS